MLLKHVHIGWKLQRTLELTMSFSLKHFFILVTISTQVATAPLKKKYLSSASNDQVSDLTENSSKSLTS